MKPSIFSILFLCLLIVIGTEAVWSQQQESFESYKCKEAMNARKDAEQKLQFWQNAFNQGNRLFQAFPCSPQEDIQACLYRCNVRFSYYCYAHIGSADAAQNRVFAFVPISPQMRSQEDINLNQLVRNYWLKQYGEFNALRTNVDYWKKEEQYWCGEASQQRRHPGGEPNLLGVPLPPVKPEGERERR